MEGAEHLGWVLAESGVLDDLPLPGRQSPQQVVSLGGGADALTYLVRYPGRAVVVKLNDEGLEAEAEALRAWTPYTSRVPEVLGLGTVPSTGGRPLKYLVLAALLNDDGRIVETADEFLDRSPASARTVGREVGAELQRMHQARRRTGFGNFADSPGAERTYADWGSYLQDFLGHHVDYLTGLGVREAEIERAYAFIRRCPFVQEGRYLHGDVSIRNVAMRAYDPVRISLFDPNPLSGDPSWDIAPMTNNAELSERRLRCDASSSETRARDRDLLAGFWESYPREVAEESLLVAQLIQGVLQAEHRELASRRGEGDALDVEVAHEFVRAVVDRMAA
jgi:fructosamine-3-kinase